MKNKNHKDVYLSTWSIIKFFLIILALILAYYLKEVILIILISYIISSALEPIIRYLEKKKIQRIYGVFLSYGFIFCMLVLGTFLISSPLIEEFDDFRKNLPQFIDKAVTNNEALKSLAQEYDFDTSNIDLSVITESAGGVAKNVFSAAGNVFSTIGTFFSIMVIALNLSLQGNVIRKLLMFLSPNKYDGKVATIIDNIEKKLGQWMIGQIALGLFIGTLTYIGMVAIGLGKYALVLAVIAGILELIPLIGPVVSGVINTIIGLLIGGFWVGLAAAIIAIIIQQLENSYIQPKVMSKAVGLNPILVMVSLLIGGTLLGVIGMILAVPITTIIVLILKETLHERYRKALFGRV